MCQRPTILMLKKASGLSTPEQPKLGTSMYHCNSATEQWNQCDADQSFSFEPVGKHNQEKP